MSPTGSRPRGEPAGFTLFELLVVMTMIGLFSSLLFSRVGSLTVESGLRNAGRMISNEVRRARHLAAATREEQGLGFDLERNLLVAPAAVRQGEYGLPAGGGERLLPDGVHLEDMIVRGTISRSGQVEIRFYPDGSTEDALIHLRDEGNRIRTLEVDPLTGAVRLYDFYVEREDE